MSMHTVKLTLQDCLQLDMAINPMIHQKLNAGLANKIYKIMKECKPHVQKAMKCKNEVTKKYGIVDADGNPKPQKDIDPDSFKKADEEFTLAMDELVEVVVPALKIGDFTQYNAQMSIADRIGFAPFITDLELVD